jgi:hypothetical protein
VYHVSRYTWQGLSKGAFPWRAKIGDKLLQFAFHLGARERAGDVDLEPQARVLIEHRQTPDTATIGRLIAHEIDAPDMVRVLGLLRRCARLMAPHTLLAPRQRQAFLAPKQLMQKTLLLGYQQTIKNR